MCDHIPDVVRECCPEELHVEKIDQVVHHVTLVMFACCSRPSSIYVLMWILHLAVVGGIAILYDHHCVSDTVDKVSCVLSGHHGKV